MTDWNGEIRDLRQRVFDTEKEIAAHKAACEERHKEIGRRFDHADTGRTGIYGEIKELRGQLQAMYNQTSQALASVQISQSGQWLRVAGAIGMAILTGVIGYIIARGVH